MGIIGDPTVVAVRLLLVGRNVDNALSYLNDVKCRTVNFDDNTDQGWTEDDLDRGWTLDTEQRLVPKRIFIIMYLIGLKVLAILGPAAGWSYTC